MYIKWKYKNCHDTELISPMNNIYFYLDKYSYIQLLQLK